MPTLTPLKEVSLQRSLRTILSAALRPRSPLAARAAGTLRYNHDYYLLYLLKHLTYFVDAGARKVETRGTCDDALVFLNPDGLRRATVRNELAHAQLIQVQAGKGAAAIELPPDCVATLSMKAG